jgi:predicted NAD/FAD-binding protein
MTYGHPVYDERSVAAQRRLPGLNTPVIAYAGAYHGWGFHEDGCRSGIEAARALGAGVGW